MPPWTSVAYVDPGSGSLVLQVLVAALVGAAVWLRRVWQATAGRLARTGPAAAEEPPADPVRARAPDAPAAPRDSLAGELAGLWRLARSSLPRRHVVFYSEQESYRAYLEDVLLELSAAGVPSLYVTSDAQDAILVEPPPGVWPLHLRRLLPLWMAFTRGPVVVMTVMDLGRHPLWRSIRPVRYAHVFHGLNSTHMTCTETAFDRFDLVLCGGPHQERELREREARTGLPEKELVSAGYPRLDRIRRAFLAAGPSQRSRPLVLVAPSWHSGNLLEVAGARAVRALTEAGCDVVLRPHAESLRRRPACAAELEQELGGPHVRVERSVAGDEALVQADVLVTDWSSIAFEYAFATERPVVWVDLPPKVRNPAWRELGIEPVEIALRDELGEVVAPGDLDRLGRVAARLAGEPEVFGPRIRAARERCVWNFGSSAAACARALRDLLERPA